MADQKEQRISARKERFCMGHLIEWTIHLDDLVHCVHRRVQLLSKTFETCCETSPSEWIFEIYRTDVGKDGSIDFTITLVRTDSSHGVLKVDAWLDFFDSSSNSIFEKQVVTKTGFLKGDFILEPRTLTPLPGMRDAIRRNLKVVVTLMITYCHVDVE